MSARWTTETSSIYGLMQTLRVVIDNRIRLPENTPPELIKRLTEFTTHTNPDYAKKKALGLWIGDTPSKIRTWKKDANDFSVPRGLTSRLREAAQDLGLAISWSDQRVSAPVVWGDFKATPRPYQEFGIEACLRRQQGIVRAPTGCLAGDSVVNVYRAGRMFEMRISEVVKRWHGLVPRSQAWDQTVATEILCWPQPYTPRLTRMFDAVATGVQRTRTLRTRSGHELTATDEHKFLGEYGWIKLCHLNVGDKIWVEHDDRHVRLTAVADIHDAGEQTTFDLLLDEPHNYIANGFVVHNSGKTLMALAVLPKLGQRALVVVRDRNLLEQWLVRAEQDLGLRLRDIGVVASGKRRVGTHLTLALQQTLYSKHFDLDGFAKQFGAVVVDEVHDAAARTVGETIDVFPARVRLGFSADHTRKDRKEFLIEDLFGEVIFEVGKSQLERVGAVVPVVVRLVPTDFNADWYANSAPEERDFTKLVSEMSTDESRCALVRRVIKELVLANAVPALVFTHRREHASRLAEQELPADGIPAGLLLGSSGNAQQFEESKSLLLSGVLKVAVGTFKAVGQGIDIPNVMAGVCATPIGANKQFFGQVRGRICRVVPGKRVGHLYYLWDRAVFPEAARNLCNWNDGLVEVYDRDSKGWVSFR